jgi:hypothetical protein
MFYTIKIKISLMQFKELRKVCQNWFFAKSLSKSHFRKLLHVSLTLTSLFENEIFVGKQILKIGFNPHTSLTLVQNFTLTLLRSISKAQNAQMRLEGSKIWVYIVIIGGGTLKGHQINGSLPLGNITRNLSLPQLIPHFSNLHWRMDNFGLPYRIELRFGK